MRRLFLFSWLIILCLSAIQGQTSTRATPVKTIFRDLEFEVIKLSYIRTDRAVAILKSIGYVVIEFEPGKDSHAGERQYTPKQSSKFNVNDVKPSELPIIIKLPETESVTLVKEEKSSSKYTTNTGATKTN